MQVNDKILTAMPKDYEKLIAAQAIDGFEPVSITTGAFGLTIILFKRIKQ